MRRILIPLIALLAGAHIANAQAMPRRLDDSQARVFLRFLAAIAERRDARPLVDTLMASRGTALLIGQQNVSRRVSKAEYDEVLVALAEGREPKLDFDRANPRAVKGAEGLLRDVVPALQWGVEHKDMLAARLSAVAAMDVDAGARRLALANLPEPAPLDVPLFLVMGGRAGAAASDDGIYFDILVMSFRDPGHDPGPAQVVAFFAHELHHVGLGRVIDRAQSRLTLDSAGSRAFALLRGLVMEGSASYLINGHRDLAALRRDPAFAASGSDGDRMREVERVLAGVLEDGWTGGAYDQAMTLFAGNALHMTGAAMLDAIWRAHGRRGVMAVLADPRQLLLRYDQSVSHAAAAFRFPDRLARRVAALGTGHGPTSPAAP